MGCNGVGAPLRQTSVLVEDSLRTNTEPAHYTELFTHKCFQSLIRNYKANPLNRLHLIPRLLSNMSATYFMSSTKGKTFAISSSSWLSLLKFTSATECQTYSFGQHLMETPGCSKFIIYKVTPVKSSSLFSYFHRPACPPAPRSTPSVASPVPPPPSPAPSASGRSTPTAARPSRPGPSSGTSSTSPAPSAGGGLRTKRSDNKRV